MPVSSQHKVYLPENAKSNQYILAEFKASPELYQHYVGSWHCYQQLSEQLFKLAEEYQLYNVHLIANDKLPVVRFHHEAYSLQTAEQVLFFYNPLYHEAQDLISTANYQAKKIQLLFLATGDNLRANAADFHLRVCQLLQQLKQHLPVKDVAIKIRDHQHLTYDLFAKLKTPTESYGYKLRSLAARYKARQLELAEHSALTYVHVTLPISRQLKQRFADNISEHSSLYQGLSASFEQAIAGKQLGHCAMVANGLTPLVRNSKFEQSDTSNELIRLGFDPARPETPFVSYCSSEKLVDSVHFLVVATEDDKTEMGFGKFMNRVEAALHSLSDKLHLDGKHQDMIVRFHQHISYLI